MPAITAADVTYTMKPYPIGSILGDRPPRYHNFVTVAFGGAGFTYPALGIPMTGNKLGMPVNQVELVDVIEAIGGLPNWWTYDATNNTLRAVVSSTGVEVATGAAVAATSLGVLARGY